MMILVEDNHLYMFVALFFYAFGAAVFYPFGMVMEAIYIKDDHNRGKQMSLSLVVKSLSAGIGIIVGAFLPEKFGYVGLSIFVGACLALSSLPFLMMLVFVPLFLFTVVDDLKTYSYLVATAVFTEAAITLIIGRKTDKHGVAHALERSFYLNAFTSGFLIFAVSNPLTAFIGDSLNKFGHSAYMTALRSGMQLIFRSRSKEDLLLFGSSYELVLCLGDMMILIILSLLAYFIGENIFYVAFVLGAWGCFASWRFFLKRENSAKK